MSYNAVAFVVFLGSSLGLGGIVLRKLPVISTLPEEKAKEKVPGLSLHERISGINPWKKFSGSMFLEKTLKKIRILSLKTDHKTFSWLQKIKENNQKKKIEEDEGYWDEVQRATRR
jgi:hypothetical protein